MFYDTLIWQAGTWALFAPAIGFYLARGQYHRSLRGSHGRYVWSGIARALMYPCLTYWGLAIVENLARGWLLAVAACAVMTLLTLSDVKDFRDDDEDDWFTGRGTKMKRWLRSKAAQAGTRLAGALGPAPAGAGA